MPHGPVSKPVSSPEKGGAAPRLRCGRETGDSASCCCRFLGRRSRWGLGRAALSVDVARDEGGGGRHEELDLARKHGKYEDRSDVGAERSRGGDLTG